MIFIYPLEFFMKTILEFSYLVTDNYGLSIIVLSIIVNIVLLPLYYMAEKWKAKDKALQDSMKLKIDNIKKHYKGQERHFYIQTIYRRFGYHPISSIKASVGFLIQIPFFFAAFHLLSNYQALHGVDFGILKDLGSPDHLIAGINVLPIVMTIVNLLSAYIYIELLNRSEKIQLFALAFIFLVVLYNEPAGLLLYWTMNNLFSLMKNLVEKKLKLGPLFSRTFTQEKIKFSIIKDGFLVEVIVVILVLYAYLTGIIHVIPDGINKVFAVKLKKVILYFPLVIVFLAGMSSLVFENIKSYSLRTLEMSKKNDFLLILLPLTPIVQYIILNQDVLTVYGSLYIIFVSTIVSIIFIISLPVLLSALGSRVLFMSLGLALLTTLFYMPLLAIEYSWYMVGSRKIQWSVLLLIFLISYFGYKKKDMFLKIAISILFIANLISISLPLIAEYTTSNLKKEQKVTSLGEIRKRDFLVGSEQKTTAVEAIIRSDFLEKPDIYLLIYDGYPESTTMKKYSIDNQQQEEYLNNMGFKRYDNMYSIGGASLVSLSTMLDMSNAIINKKFTSVEKEYTRYMMSGHTNTYAILKSQGYLLSAILPTTYMFGNNKPKLDVFYPTTLDKGYEVIIQSILMGEFTSSANFISTKGTCETFIKTKRAFMHSNVHPKFLYTHTGPDHSPVHVQCRANEIEEFHVRLKHANIEMKKDIEAIVKNNPDALIIIAGDHGPYIVGNCLMSDGFQSVSDVERINVQDAFGVFLAIRWPKSLKPIDHNITVLQDVFPSVFATLLNDKAIFDNLKVIPNTKDVRSAIAGVSVENGIIRGGENDGEPLFLNISENDFKKDN